MGWDGMCLLPGSSLDNSEWFINDRGPLENLIEECRIHAICFRSRTVMPVDPIIIEWTRLEVQVAENITLSQWSSVVASEVALPTEAGGYLGGHVGCSF